MDKYEFTERQTVEIGLMIMDHWGSHIQTGFIIENIADEVARIPYVVIQEIPGSRIRSFWFYPDGEVVEH